MGEGFEVLQGPVGDDGDGFGVVEGVGDEGFEFGEACGVMVADELVDKNYLVVDRGGKRVGLREEVVLGIVFDRADKGSLLLLGETLVMGDFLEVTETSGLWSCQM